MSVTLTSNLPANISLFWKLAQYKINEVWSDAYIIIQRWCSNRLFSSAINYSDENFGYIAHSRR